MKKELGMAILIGIVLGFTITGLIWAKKKGKFNFQTQENVKIGESEPTPIPSLAEPAIFLKIKEPENETAKKKEALTLKGETLPSATIVIIWEEGEDILLADEKGLFETEVTLVGGENEIEISAYDGEGNNASQVLTITYSTAEI